LKEKICIDRLKVGESGDHRMDEKGMGIHIWTLLVAARECFVCSATTSNIQFQFPFMLQQRRGLFLFVTTVEMSLRH